MCPLLQVAIAACLAAAASARPSSIYIDELKHDAPAAGNLTSICPIVVTVDTNDLRIPRNIKYVRCAAPPNPMCTELQLPGKECCQYQSAQYEMSCQETYDKVLVMDRGSRRRHVLHVPVGCSCTINRGWLGAEAGSLPGGGR